MDVQSLIIDSIALSLASGLGYLLKATLKPTEAEAKLIAKILMGIGMVFAGFARRWLETHHREKLDGIRSDMHFLRMSLNEHKIKG